MMKFSVGLLVILCVGATVAFKARYDNYKVFTINIKSKEQLDILNDLADSSNGFSFWSDPSLKSPTDIMVPPHQISDFDHLMKTLKLDVSLKVDNVQNLIDGEQPLVRPRAAFGWDAYYTLEELYAWLDEKVAENPDILSQEVIGETFEGREMRGLKLSRGGENNPAIFLEANIHAREWITSATATYFINELLSNEALSNLTSNIDWYFVPMANPDGFNYCHTNDRLWRKTRSTTSNLLCFGADPNRNFDFNWMTGGASSNPCSDIHAGETAFSEIETRNIRDYFERVKTNVKMYIAFHSYSQVVLLPWGHTSEPSQYHDDLMEIGNAAKEGFAELEGTEYGVGSIATIMYIASGGSADWATGVGGVNLSLTFEFRDQGRYGFLLPAEQIVPNSQELVAAMINVVAKAQELGHLPSPEETDFME